MPRLPVPKLEDTIKGYLNSVKHLLAKDDYERTVRVAHSFLHNEGKELHLELLERDRLSRVANEKSSFVRPFWNDMYLCGRYPTPINSNPFFVLARDERNTTQATRAASLVCAFSQFYLAMIDRRLAPDFAGAQPNCMDEYSRLFGCSRIPLSGKDQWYTNPKSRHIAILRGADIYTVDVVAGDGVISEELLSSLIDHMINSTANASSSKDFLGNLCAWGRDEWAATRSKIAKSNAQSLEMVDGALFVLCLDYVDPGTSLVEQCNIALHGKGQHRWYDKTFNLSVSPNASAAVNFEHSMYDGSVIRRLLDETWLMMRQLDTGRPAFAWKWSSKLDGSSLQKLKWDISTDVLGDIRKATLFNNDNCGNINVSFLDFQSYGKARIKSFKCSPDGLVQVCLQWAYHRVHNKLPGFCYEPASTKQFLCGRTEVIRASTQASTDFVKYMTSRNAEVDKKRAVELLRAACSTHSFNAKEAINGRGVDRHLFSLFKISEMGGGKTPDIYQDKAWEVSNTSVISTSNVSSEMIRCVGFGAVVPNGYGIAYGILNGSINLTASNFAKVIGTGDSGFGGVKRRRKSIALIRIPRLFVEWLVAAWKTSLVCFDCYEKHWLAIMKTCKR